jgi:hypothetical protein
MLRVRKLLNSRAKRTTTRSTLFWRRGIKPSAFDGQKGLHEPSRKPNQFPHALASQRKMIFRSHP